MRRLLSSCSVNEELKADIYGQELAYAQLDTKQSTVSNDSLPYLAVPIMRYASNVVIN